jgi:hypothetical protein
VRQSVREREAAVVQSSCCKSLSFLLPKRERRRRRRWRRLRWGFAVNPWRYLDSFSSVACEARTRKDHQMGRKPVAASSRPRVWVLGCCKLTTTLFLFLELGGVEEEAPAVPLDYTSVTMRATRKPVQQQQPKTTHEIARDELLGGDKKQEAGKQLALKQWYRQICRRSSGERSSSWDICLQEDRPNAAGTADNPKLCRKQSVNSNEELCKVGVSYSIHDSSLIARQQQHEAKLGTTTVFSSSSATRQIFSTSCCLQWDEVFSIYPHSCFFCCVEHLPFPSGQPQLVVMMLASPWHLFFFFRGVKPPLLLLLFTHEPWFLKKLKAS